MAALAPLMALLLSLAGFVALALAMERHHRQVWQRAPSRKQCLLLRCAGVIGLGAALAACVAHAGWATGTVIWLGLMTVAALTVALVLSYRPRWLALMTAQFKLGQSGTAT